MEFSASSQYSEQMDEPTERQYSPLSRKRSTGRLPDDESRHDVDDRVLIVARRPGISERGVTFEQDDRPVRKPPARHLWIDLRRSPNRPTLFEEACPRRLRGLSDVDSAMAIDRPRFICFDFDDPADSDLQLLRATRHRYPHIPVLVLAEHRTADLILFALRLRVWDYLIKPVTWAQIAVRIDVLDQVGNSGRDFFLPPLPETLCGTESVRPPGSQALRTQAALDFVDKHYREPLPVLDAARLCHMSPFHFCRVFKQDHGITFHHYVIDCRLREASRLLRTTVQPVKAIARAVGFSDTPHFTRAFTRQQGISPARFRSSSSPGA
jgi:AraC-like DNA-binding protein/CheY-like chemotaxis protein